MKSFVLLLDVIIYRENGPMITFALERKIGIDVGVKLQFHPKRLGRRTIPPTAGLPNDPERVTENRQPPLGMVDLLIWKRSHCKKNAGESLAGSRETGRDPPPVAGVFASLNKPLSYKRFPFHSKFLSNLKLPLTKKKKPVF